MRPKTETDWEKARRRFLRKRRRAALIQSLVQDLIFVGLGFSLGTGLVLIGVFVPLLFR